MTDKRLDDLLRASMAAEEQPPELPVITPAKTKKRPWIGAVAACLCLCLCAGAFLLMDFGSRTAAPEAAVEDAVSQGTVLESFKHSLTDSAAPALKAPAAPPVTDANETCSPSSSANKWWQAMKQGVQPRFDLEDWDTNYVVMGDSEQYYSIQVTKGNDMGYFTVDKTTCEMVKLEDVRDKLETTVIADTELVCNVEREVQFFINSKNHVMVIE